MTLRDAFTSALAGPLVKARARSAGVAPCAPTPGRRRIACGSSLRASPTAPLNPHDVAASISAVRLAFAFRAEFGHDAVIDLVGYRRFGHNEADEPAYTQPEMYQIIKDKKRVAELYADALVAEGVITREEVDAQQQEVWDHL